MGLWFCGVWGGGGESISVDCEQLIVLKMSVGKSLWYLDCDTIGTLAG